MRRIFSNRTVMATTAVFAVAGTFIVRENPFGTGTIPWIGAIAVSLVGNAVLAFLVVPWAAPYMASTGGKTGAKNADPRSVANAEKVLTAVILSIALVGMLAVDATSRGLIITPTDRLEKIAKVVKTTVEGEAPEKYRRQLSSADTWKMSERTYRTCVPDVHDDTLSRAWCVLIRIEGGRYTVLRAGEGISNARQFLKWHPDYKPEKRYY
jgi:hypothetical protein